MDPLNGGSRFSPTENSKRFLVDAKRCSSGLRTDRYIDAQWQSTFAGSAEGRSSGEQSAVHYRSHAADAFAEVSRDPFCGGSRPYAGDPPPLVPGVTIKCAQDGVVNLTDCAVIARQGNFVSAVVVDNVSSVEVLSTVRAIARFVAPALAGRPTRVRASTSKSFSAAPPTGVWSVDVARSRFTAMTSDRDADQCARDLDRARDDGGATPQIEGLVGYASKECADDARLVRANLSYGRWPAKLRPAIDALRAALAREQAAFTKVFRSRTFPQFLSRYAAARPTLAATDRRIDAVFTILR